jgi:hypothetical protein
MVRECYSSGQSAQPRWAIISVYVIFATVFVSWTYVIIAMLESEQYETSHSRPSAMVVKAVSVTSSRQSQDRF